MNNRWIYYIRHLLCALVILGGFYYFAAHRGRPGAEIDSRCTTLERQQPDAVLIGDSLLRAGVDEASFERLTGLKTLKVAQNGSASAWWYLYVKNVAATAPHSSCSHSPRLVFICFRDHFLTDPTFRVDGTYRKPIRVLSRKEEPLLERLTSGETLHAKALTWVAAESREWLERCVARIAASCVGKRREMVEQALGTVFAEEKMISQLITHQQLKAEEAGGEGVLNFAGSLPNSFLPEMINVMKESGFQPVFVRMKRVRDLEAGAEPPEVAAYVSNLTRYLQEEGVFFIDFTYDERIQKCHYGPGDHLNGEGKELFTRLLAEQWRKILSLHTISTGVL